MKILQKLFKKVDLRTESTVESSNSLRSTWLGTRIDGDTTRLTIHVKKILSLPGEKLTIVLSRWIERLPQFFVAWHLHVSSLASLARDLKDTLTHRQNLLSQRQGVPNSLTGVHKVLSKYLGHIRLMLPTRTGSGFGAALGSDPKPCEAEKRRKRNCDKQM